MSAIAPARFYPAWCNALLAAIVAAISTVPAVAQSSFYRASPEEIAGPPGTLIRQEPMLGAPAGRRCVPRALSLDGPSRRTDCRLRRHHRAARPTAARRASDRGVGASHHRRRPALCAVDGPVPVSADTGQPAHGRTRLRDRCDRLSGARHARTAPLSRRRQRRPRRTGLRACGPRDTRRRRRQRVLRSGGIRKAVRPRFTPASSPRAMRLNSVSSASPQPPRRPISSRSCKTISRQPAART